MFLSAIISDAPHLSPSFYHQKNNNDMCSYMAYISRSPKVTGLVTGQWHRLITKPR